METNGEQRQQQTNGHWIVKPKEEKRILYFCVHHVKSCHFSKGSMTFFFFSIRTTKK